jgi:hypothetical protein
MTRDVGLPNVNDWCNNILVPLLKRYYHICHVMIVRRWRVTRSGGPHAGSQVSGGWPPRFRLALRQSETKRAGAAAENRRRVAQRQDPHQ